MTLTFEEQSSDLYSSPYLVDYYDLVAPNSRSVDDASFYWEVYQKLFALRSPTPEDPFVILDVGTGTGRVLHGLESNAINSECEFVNTEIVGVDNAQHMLDKAEMITTGILKNCVSWVHGSALNLREVMDARKHQKVDLLIFSIGSISHLYESGQPEEFLNQASKVLRPRTGRAYVSIYDGSLLNPNKKIAFHQPQGVSELKSAVFASIVYRESDHRGELEGNVKFLKFELEVVDSDNQSVVETNHISMKMRQWLDDELILLSSETDACFVESVRGAHETFYVFKAIETGSE
jgi:SAM-dependent methyltransferase